MISLPFLQAFRGGPEVLRLPVPAAARAAAAGAGHRRDRGGLPHGRHQLLPASQRHSILGWDHCLLSGLSRFVYALCLLSS